MQLPVVCATNLPAVHVTDIATAAVAQWDIDLRFNLVTHLPSRISVAIDDRQNCTPLYIGDPLPLDLLAAVCTRALDLWRGAQQRRASAAA